MFAETSPTAIILAPTLDPYLWAMMQYLETILFCVH